MGGEQLTIGITSMIPVGKETSLSTWAGTSGGKDMERDSFMVGKLGNSNIYSIPFAYIAYDCATSPFIRRSILICILLRLAHGPPCPTASWAQVSSLKEVPMAPKTLEPLPGDSYA